LFKVKEKNMHKIKIAIVEDSDTDIYLLENLLKTYFSELTLVGVAKDAESAYQLILETAPDIVILDMELQNSKGFDVLEKFKGLPKFQTIACTSNEQYAKDCFAYKMVDFLLKPYKLEALVSAISKAKEQLTLIKNSEPNKIAFPRFIALGSLYEATIVKPSDISYLKADGRYTLVVLKSGKSTLISKLLGDFEKLLDPALFYRVHYSFIINLDEVVSFNRPKTTFCLLRSGEKVPVSQRKAASFSKHLLQG
jgi:two-component system LytT family response regulator